MLCYPLIKWKCRGLFTMLTLIVVMPVLLPAQDVMVGSPNWFFLGPVADELPKTIKAYKPDYPADMRKTAETGYVIVLRYIDERGEARGAQMCSTHQPFERAVEASFYQWKIAPAKQHGVPVGSWSWIPLIFNPRAAKADVPESIPRLLTVDVAVLPVGTSKPGDTFFVPVKLRLDEAGTIVQTDIAAQVSGSTRVAIGLALKNWRFAPARHDGHAIATEITLPVLCLSRWEKSSGEYTPPKIIKLVDPEYPRVMQQYGINGQVTVEFIVESGGHVRNPIITSSDNPAFDEPALEALLKWEFRPGQIDGVKTNVSCRQSIQFSLDNGGDSLFQLRDRTDQSKLPPELRYDTPAKIRSVRIPVYPYEQRQKNIRGKAAATALVDQHGHIALIKVRTADQAEFGLALTAALECFSFDPALKDGKPASQLINFEQSFDSTKLPDEEGDRLLNLEKKHPDKIVAANLLDLPLQPVSRNPPIFPKALLEKFTAGDTLIDILVDERGRARLPRVVSATDPAFGYAAVQAVASWWFQPPLQNGKPVVTRVRVPITFNLTQPSSALSSVKVEPSG